MALARCVNVSELIARVDRLCEDQTFTEPNLGHRATKNSQSYKPYSSKIHNVMDGFTPARSTLAQIAQ